MRAGSEDHPHASLHGHKRHMNETSQNDSASSLKILSRTAKGALSSGWYEGQRWGGDTPGRRYAGRYPIATEHPLQTREGCLDAESYPFSSQLEAQSFAVRTGTLSFAIWWTGRAAGCWNRGRHGAGRPLTYLQWQMQLCQRSKAYLEPRWCWEHRASVGPLRRTSFILPTGSTCSGVNRVYCRFAS